MPDRALVVFTRKSKESLLNAGGTSAWAINPAVVRGFDYVICARNSSGDPDDRQIPGPEPRGSAFLVGKISTIDWLYFENERNRYRINFSEVAEVNVEGFWDGSRNPVRYYTLDQVRDRGIDLAALEFISLAELEPRKAAEQSTSAEEIPGDSFDDALNALARVIGVPADRIEVTIKPPGHRGGR